MRKVLSIIALSAMTLSLSSFSTSKQAAIQAEGDCLDYAMAAMVDEQEMYGFIRDRGAYLEGLLFYYDSCMDDGEVLDPVFM